jgi:hypothetical protein
MGTQKQMRMRMRTPMPMGTIGPGGGAPRARVSIRTCRPGGTGRERSGSDFGEAECVSFRQCSH